ncbi:major facilitator superfamily domain-containing protein [Phyllosticta capitalensis]
MARFNSDTSLSDKDEKYEVASEERHSSSTRGAVLVTSDYGIYKAALEEQERRRRREERGAKGAMEVDDDLDIEKQSVASFKTASSSLNLPERYEPAAEEPYAADPNVVDWDGPNDPANPMNWPKSRKWLMISVVSALTFLIPLGSSMFAPGVPELMEEFGSNSEVLAGFVVSIYVLGFAFGPLIIAPLSEMYGRLPLYHVCSVLFIVFMVACALSKNLAMLIVFRFLAGTVGGAPLTLGGGTIADLVPPKDRGTAMAIWVAGPTIAPVIGPVGGGFLAQAVSWRWVFWVVSIATGVITIIGFILMRETYPVAILNAKVRRLRKETGNKALRSKLDSGLAARALFLRSIVRPAKMLIFSPIVFLLSLYVAIAYSYLYILFTTFTTVFESSYGFSPGIAGLTYLGVGVGCVLGQWAFTVFGNRIAREHLEKGDFVPEHRLPLMFPGAITMPVGFFIYGWCVQYQVHWIVPIIGTGFIGFGLMLLFMAPNTYLVDVYTMHAASAMAANTVLRSTFAAFIPLAGQPMYRALGLGWGNSLLGFVAIALIPIPLLFVKYGATLRTRFVVKL